MELLHTNTGHIYISLPRVEYYMQGLQSFHSSTAEVE